MRLRIEQVVLWEGARAAPSQLTRTTLTRRDLGRGTRLIAVFERKIAEMTESAAMSGSAALATTRGSYMVDGTSIAWSHLGLLTRTLPMK